MLLNRITVLTRLGKNKGGKRRRDSETLIDELEITPLHLIEDKDLWENTKYRLRFRKFPWPLWIMGLMWMCGTIWIIYEIGMDRLKFREWKILKEYSILAFTFIMGFLFCYKGKTRTINFDKIEDSLTVKKRNIFCDKRSIVTYRLRDITDVRAV